MSLTKNYQQLALYNRWMNTKIYNATLKLSDEELKKDRSAFFRSIHSTMNHIFWADIGWISRFQGKTYPVERGGMGEDIIEDYKTLSIQHMKMADHIVNWTQTLEEEALIADYSWTPAWGGEPITKPFCVLVTHLFNHQTHHRGQVTQMLHPMGIDIGNTDLPLMP